MVIDTSAMVAIFLDEPECATFRDLILDSPVRLISAVTVFETGIVLEARLGPGVVHDFEQFLQRAEIDEMAIDGALARTALAAWRKYGKGHHRARLNMGDCFAYALARSSGEPLLAKGEDFPKTDVALCWPKSSH
jgi:ribonuclease VapC